MTPDRIKDLLATAIKNNTTAWSAQSKYFNALLKRNVASFASLSDVPGNSLKEIGEPQTFNQAIGANIAYEDTVRDELKILYDDSRKSWERLQDELKGIYPGSASDDEAA